MKAATGAKRWHRVAPGIYRDGRTGNLYERPSINGRPTFRKLRARSLKLAKEELAAKRTLQSQASLGLAQDPYERRKRVQLRALFERWSEAGCPKRNGERSVGRQLDETCRRLDTLDQWWGTLTPPEVSAQACQQYANARRKEVRAGSDGGRSIDLELSTLSTALHFGVLHGMAEFNPLAGSRPKFYQASQAHHCREFAPVSGDDLHALATALFESPKSEALGWQLLVQAMTGCRTSEALRLRWDAKSRDEAGFVESEWLWLRRSKGGVNPFAVIHPALKECLAALAAWRRKRFPDSPWFFPSPDDPKRHVDTSALVHALKRIGPLVSKAKRTAHGLRAYFVTVRRSQGISDAQVAAEIGDATGAAIIASTYGAVPPNWRGGAELSFMPKDGKPAWHTLPHTRRGPAVDVS